MALVKKVLKINYSRFIKIELFVHQHNFNLIKTLNITYNEAKIG
jgi:hypothetical protein